ncbi:helix-turn-helix transcriptional regulator [Solirhodobacter olei]|uniref:helix-turn-helix transcriptional regulator n=1 Tax=Solirhodobacter olei TaxID=2493082 RepID=UPI0019D49E96|nr:helix-turn-helix domain-containing protein [Solirhodobacter olei]
MQQEIMERLERIERTLAAPRREFLDTNQAAGFLGLSRQQLELWRLRGGGPAVHRVGRKCLYSVDDLRAFMAGLRREPLA